MRRFFALVILICLVATGCRSTAESADPEAPATSETPSVAEPAATPESGSSEQSGGSGPDESEDPSTFNDPSAGPDRSPDEPRVVPPLDLPASAPGTDEAAAALIEDLSRFITPEEMEAGVPWPDLRNPDPVASYQSDARFQNWMSVNNPTPILVEAYTAPNSPERGFDLEMFSRRDEFDLRAGPADPPYSMRVEDLVHPAATGITDALLSQVPAGSAAVVYWDSVGPTDIFNTDGIYQGSNPGWVDVGPWVAIMAPTDVGWQVWWDELTEPPPPGSREQRGTPQPEDRPRIDLY